MKQSARLTVDMSSKEHSYLKTACAKLGVSMREFVVIATFEKMEHLEDTWLAKKAHETLQRIESGKEKTVSWKTVKRRLKIGL